MEGQQRPVRMMVKFEDKDCARFWDILVQFQAGPWVQDTTYHFKNRNTIVNLIAPATEAGPLYLQLKDFCDMFRSYI